MLYDTCEQSGDISNADDGDDDSNDDGDDDSNDDSEMEQKMST